MLVDFATVASQIGSGKSLFLAGDENLLKRLPKGNWIGGALSPTSSTGGGDDDQGLDLHDRGPPTRRPASRFLGTGRRSCPASFRKRPTTASPSSSFRLGARPTSATRGTPPAMKRHLPQAHHRLDFRGRPERPGQDIPQGLRQRSDRRILRRQGHRDASYLGPGQTGIDRDRQSLGQGSGDVIAFDEEGFSSDRIALLMERSSTSPITWSPTRLTPGCLWWPTTAERWST